MSELERPAEIPQADWELTPASVRVLLVTLLARTSSQESRIRELELRLGLHSQNSSKPPSADPPDAPPRPARTPRGRPRGGQVGHEGHHREQLPPEQLDEIVAHHPPACPQCQHALPNDLPDAAPPRRQQVWDIPPLKPFVTEHQYHSVCCPECATLVTAERPANVPAGAFGPRVAAFVSLLHARYRISNRETAELLSDGFGLSISLGSIVALQQEMSRALEGVASAIQAVVEQQAVANVDETSWKEAGARRWLWVAVTAVASLFMVSLSRSAQSLHTLLGTEFGGVVGSDRAKAYNSLPLDKRQLCWAHIQRNILALYDNAGPDRPWTEAVLDQSDLVFGAWHAWREGKVDRAGLQQLLAPVQHELRRLLEQGQAVRWYRISGISTELLAKWEALWTFARVAGVEPTNNGAERALRPAVLWRKGCFGAQSAEGNQFVARLLTVIATCRQQDRHLLTFLTDAISTHWAGQPAPVLVKSS
jgi:transposase